MKLIISSIILVIISCNSTKKTTEMQNLTSGNYEILEFNADDFSAQKTYTIRINAEEQRISGKFDCNNFNCEYDTDGRNIEFGYAIASKMYCEGEMKNENTFFKYLGRLKSFEFDGEMLKFFGEDEKMILKLKKQES